MVWGLYRSVIAYNMPDNNRETLAIVSIFGRQVAEIGYRMAPRAPVSARQVSRSVPSGLTSASAMLSSVGDRLGAGAKIATSLVGWNLRCVLVDGGQFIRRQTAYDAIAYAMLWTSQYKQESMFTGNRVLSVPGGSVVVRFVSYPMGRHMPMTLGAAATIAEVIPSFLEDNHQFREAYIEVLTPDDQPYGIVGIWKRGSPPADDIL